MTESRNNKSETKTKNTPETLAAKEKRLEREAKALRANLLRRKQQQRSRPSEKVVSENSDR